MNDQMKMAATKKDRLILEMIVSKIIAVFDVDFIFLFGSRARGNAHSDSDFDICVVTEMPGVDQKKRALEVSKLFLPRNFGLDVIVKTPAEFEVGCKTLNHICQEIQKGIVIYQKES